MPVQQFGDLLLEVGDAVRESGVVAAESLLGSLCVLGRRPERAELCAK